MTTYTLQGTRFQFSFTGDVISADAVELSWIVPDDQRHFSYQINSSQDGELARVTAISAL